MRKGPSMLTTDAIFPKYFQSAVDWMQWGRTSWYRVQEYSHNNKSLWGNKHIKILTVTWWLILIFFLIPVHFCYFPFLIIGRSYTVLLILIWKAIQSCYFGECWKGATLREMRAGYEGLFLLLETGWEDSVSLPGWKNGIYYDENLQFILQVISTCPL